AGRAPAYLSGFIGREAELRALGADLERARLVTLTGPGGCGKTRLAAEFCRSAADFEACVFVALASCADAGRIAERTHAAARLPLGNASPLEHLADRFGAQRLLLVLDNFEQLVDGGGAQVLLEILDRLPLARALVTSRRVLRIAGEQELALRPFALPRADDDAARALRNPAVALFINRARSVRPDFGLNAGNRSDLLRLCRALEGLPLAIEIAASRIRTYTPREMASGIGRRFDLLVRGGGEAARDPRHASLRAAIDWSWRLLDAPQRAFLIALSVFRGGWTADEAGAVAGCSAPHGVLDALVADSLVTVDEQAGAMRFEMLESVREYLVEQADPELRQRLRRAHRACFLARAIDLGEHPGPLPEAALANFVEALASGIEDGEHELAVALALALRPQWESQGLPPQALALLRRLADVAPVATPRLVSLLAMLVRQLVSAAEPGAAAALAERTVELAGTDPAQRAEALLARARATWVCRLDGPACLPQVHEALGLARQAGALDLEAPLCLLLGAITLQHLHDPVAADAIQQRTIECYVRLGRPREAYSAWHARMWCLQRQGRHAQAIALGLAQLREVEALGHGEAQILFLNRLAASHEALRDYAQALDASRREAALAWQRHKIYNLALALWNQCYYLARLRRPEDAARLLAFASRFWVERFDALGVDDLRTVERVRRLVAAQIGAARWPGLWARGQAMGLHEALELGGALG
ncbi:MAG: hypothetical protein KGO01_17975, partial [Burkholderiales bacterium]|nr:hypothetical protein [Burkholderiales bacterium]